jgi:hypothetical protein
VRGAQRPPAVFADRTPNFALIFFLRVEQLLFSIAI